eukprot:scaffold141452_cov232-Phaeocystis_antarctica.AAC.2
MNRRSGVPSCGAATPSPFVASRHFRIACSSGPMSSRSAGSTRRARRASAAQGAVSKRKDGGIL